MRYYLLSEQEAAACGIDLRYHSRTADGRVVVPDREIDTAGVEVNSEPVDCETALKLMG